MTVADCWKSCAWLDRDDRRCNRTAVATRTSESGWTVPVCELHEAPVTIP